MAALGNDGSQAILIHTKLLKKAQGDDSLACFYNVSQCTNPGQRPYRTVSDLVASLCGSGGPDVWMGQQVAQRATIFLNSQGRVLG